MALAAMLLAEGVLDGALRGAIIGGAVGLVIGIGMTIIYRAFWKKPLEPQ